MSYFNHDFHQLHLGTKATTANTNQVKGFITAASIPTSSLGINTGTAATDYGPGSYGFFDPKTNLSVTAAGSGSCNLYLGSASLMTKDIIAPFHGGYKESAKSKEINPKYVSAWKRVDTCSPQQAIVHVGSTKYTKTLSPSNSACNFSFICGETYTLRIDVQGSPVLRFLNHNGYRLFQYSAPCCADNDPAATIDGTLAMISWANQLIADPLYKDFISPIVYSEAGNALYAPGTTGGVPTWDNYVSPGHVANTYAGLRLLGAYVETKFGNCSFQVSDFYEIEPLKIFVSMTDFSGAPCTFTGICTAVECPGIQGNGFGDTVVRDLILSESYKQNHFPTDIRMREIEQGSDILNSVDRATLYTRYLLTHSVPRRQNPSSVFDSDVYTLEIITNGSNASLETFVSTWLGNANNSCAALDVIGCTQCSPLTP